MHAMASSGSTKVESARMWQESALHVDYRVLLSQAKGGLGGVAFEVRVGRKLARRSGMLMFGGDNKVSSRQEEGSTMNCSCSKGRCRGVVVFVNCWKGECSQRQQLVHQLLCAYQGRDSQTHFKQRAFRRLTTHPAASSLAASRLVIYAQPLANRTCISRISFYF